MVPEFEVWRLSPDRALVGRWLPLPRSVLRVKVEENGATHVLSKLSLQDLAPYAS
jgi:hypothetical protein